MKLLGIDIGGTKTAVCAGDETGRLFASQRMATPQDADTYRRNLLIACRRTAEEAGWRLGDVGAVGISAPGPLSVQDGLLLAPPNNPGFANLPIVRIVQEGVNVPVYFNNDANAAALAEWRFGAFRGTPDLVYLTFSTGMGGGVITNGRLVQGKTDSAGEFGHMVLDPSGPSCGCGLRGCWESFVGGRMVSEQVKGRIRREAIRTQIVAEAGGDVEAISMRAITEAYRKGDPLAVEVWSEVLERLAQGIGIILMALDPQVILLGTMAIREADIVMPLLMERLPRYAWKWPLEKCRIAPASLGDRIGDLAGLAVALVGWESSEGRGSEKRRLSP